MKQTQDLLLMICLGKIAKNKVFPYVINKYNNKEYLKNVIYTTICDLAIVYKVVIEESEEGLASITVTTEMLKNWGITIQELHETAIRNNNSKEPEFVEMEDMLMSLMSGSEIDNLYLSQNVDLENKEGMYTLRNAETCGSAVLLNTFALNRVSDILESDLIIIPSSIHEVIVIRVEKFHEERINDLIIDINKSECEDEEVLSDHLYYYNKKEGLTW